MADRWRCAHCQTEIEDTEASMMEHVRKHPELAESTIAFSPVGHEWRIAPADATRVMLLSDG